MTFLEAALAQFDLGSVFILVVTIVVFVAPIFILFPPIPVERSDALQQTHSKLGARSPKSEPHTQHSQNKQTQARQPAKIQSLCVCPIEFCRGIELSRAKVLSHGLEHDRLFTFAQLKPNPGAAADAAAAAATGAGGTPELAWETLTPRLMPGLAKIKVDIWFPDPGKTSRLLGKLEGGFLVARFPWADTGLRGLLQLATAKLSRGLGATPEREFMLPLEFPSKADMAARGYSLENVTIRNSVMSAINMGRELPPELADYLGVKHRLGLFRTDPANTQTVSRLTSQKSALVDQPGIELQDEYPMRMLSLKSVHALDARNLQANIIVAGVEQDDDEKSWRSVQFKRTDGHNTTDEAPCHFDVFRTVQCTLPSFDPTPGTHHKAQSDQAVGKRRNTEHDPPEVRCFGMHLCPLFQDTGKPEHLHSSLETGMEVMVLRRD